MNSTTTQTSTPEFTITGTWPAPDYATSAQRVTQDAELSKLIFSGDLNAQEAKTMLGMIPASDLDPEEYAELQTIASGENLSEDLARFDGRPEF